MAEWGLITYGDKVQPAGRKGEAQGIRNVMVASGHDATDIRVARVDPPSQAVIRANERRQLAAAAFPGLFQP